MQDKYADCGLKAGGGGGDMRLGDGHTGRCWEIMMARMITRLFRESQPGRVVIK